MNDFINTVEQHTNYECAEEIAQLSLVSLTITGIIYCLALLL